MTTHYTNPISKVVFIVKILERTMKTINDLLLIRETSKDFEDAVDNHSCSIWSRVLQQEDINDAFSVGNVYIIRRALDVLVWLTDKKLEDKISISIYNHDFFHALQKNTHLAIDKVILQYKDEFPGIIETIFDESVCKMNYKRIKLLLLYNLVREDNICYMISGIQSNDMKNPDFMRVVEFYLERNPESSRKFLKYSYGYTPLTKLLLKYSKIRGDGMIYSFVSRMIICSVYNIEAFQLLIDSGESMGGLLSTIIDSMREVINLGDLEFILYLFSKGITIQNQKEMRLPMTILSRCKIHPNSNEALSK